MITIPVLDEQARRQQLTKPRGALRRLEKWAIFDEAGVSDHEQNDAG